MHPHPLHDLAARPSSASDAPRAGSPAVTETRVIHEMHRRATSLLASVTRPSPEASELRDVVIATLEHHHSREDEDLWPMLVERAPHLRSELADHLDDEGWDRFSARAVATAPPAGLPVLIALVYEVGSPAEAEVVFRHVPPEARATIPARRAVGERTLDAHRELWDAFTFRRLAGVGVGPGWRCLEIGAGTGSVAAWLAERVGPTGMVVATDVETRWLEALATSNLEVRHHNVADDPVDHGYDLIHLRLVLEHLPGRPRVVAKLAAALRPGGHLVVEDYDVRTMQLGRGVDDTWIEVNRAVIDAMAGHGVDLTCGQSLPDLLRGAGLEHVEAEALVHPMPIPAMAAVFRPPLERMAPLVIAAGTVTQAQVDHVLRSFDGHDDAPVAYSPALVSATGRRPASSSASRRIASPDAAGA